MVGGHDFFNRTKLKIYERNTTPYYSKVNKKGLAFFKITEN